jgi:hypothetical protein
LSTLADEMFPPKKDHTVPDSFNDALYWRDDVLDDWCVNEPAAEVAAKTTATTTTATATTMSTTTMATTTTTKPPAVGTTK